MLDLGEIQLDQLVINNGKMLDSCELFGKGNGNYAVAEIAWYRAQMTEID
jgi:hypothetical protein